MCFLLTRYVLASYREKPPRWVLRLIRCLSTDTPGRFPRVSTVSTCVSPVFTDLVATYRLTQCTFCPLQLLEEHLAKLEAGGSDNEDAGSDAGWDEWDQDSDAESDDSGGWNDVYSDDDEVEIDLSDSDDDEETQTRRQKKRELQEKRKKALAGLATKEEVNEEEESNDEEEKGMDAEDEEEGSEAGETADAISTAGDSVATTESRFSVLATQKVRRPFIEA